MTLYIYERYSRKRTYVKVGNPNVLGEHYHPHLSDPTRYRASYSIEIGFSASHGYWGGETKVVEVGGSPPTGLYVYELPLKMYKISNETFTTNTGMRFRKSYLNECRATYSKGSLIDEVVGEEDEYPLDGQSGNYWYVRKGLANQAPTISGEDSSLGDKDLGFVISYQVNDEDVSDSLVVTEKLNGSIIRTINGAPRNQDLEIEITNEKLFGLELNSENTIEIKVDDGQGAIAYRRYTFRRTNSAPIISGQDEDLGEKTESFSIDFSVSDNEGDVITVETYLNNILKEEYQAEDGITNTFTISKVDWYKLPIGQHSIKIEATDEHGATAIRNYTFTRYDDKIQFNLKNPIETDIMATKALVTPTWSIPEGAVAKVEACNNGFDENPIWEDITSQVLISRHYNFTNDTKTSDVWGIDIRFTIERGTATEEVVIDGFGGAFE